MQDFFKNLVKKLEVDLTDAFDRNFENKSFFGKTWDPTTLPNNRGTVMMRSGKLRKSIKAKVSGNQISWTSSLPYASLQNEGGEVIVTQKMKSYFWAMYYKSTNAVVFSVKTKAAAKTQRNAKLSAEAKMWQSLALQKVGAKMKIKQRQFIGDHPQVRQRIKKVIDNNMKEIAAQIKNNFKR